MKMLYVLSPPHTPPPSPWMSMRDSSPPLSCPSSNSNSSSSINSSCSYTSSQSGRDSVSIERVVHTSTENGRDGNKFPTGNSMRNELKREVEAVKSVVRRGSNENRTYPPSHYNSSNDSFNSKCPSDFCNHSSCFGATCPNRSQSEKSFTASNEGQTYSIRVSQSMGRCDGRDSTSCVHRVSGREHAGGRNPLRKENSAKSGRSVGRSGGELGWEDGRRGKEGGRETGVNVVCKNKTSKATRIWLNAIEKANARGTRSNPAGEAKSKVPPGGSGCVMLKHSPRCGCTCPRGRDGGADNVDKVTPRHFSKNVRGRLKRKVSIR